MSKLNPEQKVFRKTLKKLHPDVAVFHYPYHGVTIGIRKPKGKRSTCGHITWAMLGADEDKYREKMGEFLVLQRFDVGLILPIRCAPNADEFELATLAGNFLGSM